jgi:Ca2+-binding RTX toxin-like protein
VLRAESATIREKQATPLGLVRSATFRVAMGRQPTVRRSHPPLALVAAVTVLVPPVTAVANSTSVIVNNEKGFLYIKGGQGANELTVGRDETDNQFVISSNLPIVPQTNCQSVFPTQARCSGSPQDTSLRADLGEGNDRMTLTSPSDTGGVFGGPGNDRITTGAGRNVIDGDDGNDDVSAGAGNDRVFGGPGRDTLRGGPGSDRLRADDGERDAVIDCGPGDDAVQVDSTDPLPRDCERVHVADNARQD